ncbi:DUF6069 family protein [Euzebya pacifica]|uniref:DUF6069 family protein n=1 Tax=Euzebya pacifica TaxID=1608957 RepID=UPI0030FC8ACD
MAGAIPVQTQEDIVPPTPKPIGYRLAGVLLAPGVAATMHLVLTGPLGLSLEDGFGLMTVTLAPLVVGMVAWIAVMLLEQGLGKEKSRRIWMAVAFGALAASILAIVPADVTTGAKWGLVALFSAVAVVLIPTMAARGQKD